MNTLVTGGAGFIGSHLVKTLLEMNHKVVVLDNFSTGRKSNLNEFVKDIKVIECDLSETGEWQSEVSQCSQIYHLAALADIVPSIQRPEDYFKANVVGTMNLLKSIKSPESTKVVYTASSSCYGIPDIYPTPEKSKISPQYPYALTKRLGEELVIHWGIVYSLQNICLRLFNVYGPKSRTSGTYGAVFGVFLKQKLENHPFTVVGDGTQTRDFTYVSDIINALVTSMESACIRGVYNVGSGKTVSVNRIVELLGGQKIFIEKRPGEPNCTFADIQKIKTELNWVPTVAIEEGIKELVKNIDYWREAPLWTPKELKLQPQTGLNFYGKINVTMLKKYS